MTSNCKKALGYWTIGIQYLHLVHAVSNETINQGNPHCIISDHLLTIEEYNKQSKWSDHNLIIPLLFNLYHGIEVLLKGFLTSRGVQFKASHKLSILFEEFQREFPETDLVTLFEKYINQEHLPKILDDFCKTSNITMNDYFQSLKYAESTKNSKFYHLPLKYKGEEGIEFFKELVYDIEKIRKESVSLGRAICKMHSKFLGIDI